MKDEKAGGPPVDWKRHGNDAPIQYIRWCWQRYSWDKRLIN